MNSEPLFAEKLVRQWYSEYWHSSYASSLQFEIWCDVLRLFAIADETDLTSLSVLDNLYSTRFTISYSLCFLKEMLVNCLAHERNFERDLMPINWEERIDVVLDYLQQDQWFSGYYRRSDSTRDELRIVWNSYVVYTPSPDSHAIPLTTPTVMDKSGEGYFYGLQEFYNAILSLYFCNAETFDEDLIIACTKDSDGMLNHYIEGLKVVEKYRSWVFLMCFYKKATGVRMFQALNQIKTWK